MPMNWEKSDAGEMWRWMKAGSTAVIHLSKTRGTYEVSIIHASFDMGMGLNVGGFDSVKEAQEWAALLLRED